MAIEVKITGNQGEIILKEDDNNLGAENVDFIFDSDDKVQDKSYDALVGLKLSGKISGKNKEETLELGKWALCTSGEGAYRKVNVKIINSDSDIVREYDFSSMFVVDYNENFNKQGVGEYEIVLRQKSKETGIEIFA